MRYRIALKNGRAKGETCPLCKTVWQDFAEILDGVFACYRCGNVFVAGIKEEREAKANWACAERVKQEEKKKEETYPCPHCDKVFTKKIALIGHMRKHKDGSDQP